MNLAPNRKIAIYAPSLRGGGVERNAINLSRGLAEKGYSVDLVLTRAEGPFLKEVDDRVNLVDLAASRTLFSIPRLAGYLRKVRPAVMLSGMAHANFAAIVARKMAGATCRLVVSVHTCWSVGDGFTENWLDRNTAMIGRILYPRSDGIVAVSEAVAADLVKISQLNPATITVIPNPVAMAGPPVDSGQNPDHPFLQEGGVPLVVAVGRLSPEKGFDVLLRAHALLLEQGRVHLLILGEGKERPRLESLVDELGSAGQVDMPGFVDSPSKYIAKASVVAMPSRIEGFGNALVEAMACGVPVVATKGSGGPGEILAGGRYGPLVPPDDPGALSRAITEVISNPVAPSELIERAGDFTVDRVVDRYLEVLFPREALS